ncbi:Major Facilitator Superfamily protein [Abditibacterium utsteinense]|uniref:Major Facilitator Superfamily protein n=1 Tax=Abditibacterium utsteinense TaxID=1960156 RepID=A0A2S8SRM6_9BACT|nr:MFS transporter [Abditibacterium utsteinense]PQV63461.1 Major Facilitator Superfamily protein [Abditibacterium utsteinense]
MKKLIGKSGPLGVFFEFPTLLKLGIICTFAEMAWATLLLVLEFFFKDELLKGESPQFIASKVAFAFLAFAGAETLFKYPMGALADKYGPRRFVVLALSICCVTPFLMWGFGTIFPGQWWPFILTRAIDGFAAAALWPAMSALMSRAVPREAKAAAMSVFNAAYMVGLAIGPMTGLYLGHRFGTNLYVFPFCAGLMALGLFVALKTIPRTVRDPNFHGEDLKEERALLKGRPMLVKMMALYALSQVGVGILAPTIPIYIDTQFGLQQADLPRLIALPALFVVLIAVPLGRVPDSIGQARSVWISYILAAVGMVCIALTSQFAPTKNLASSQVGLFGFGMLAMIVSYILGTPAWLGLTSLQVDDKKQAQALSLMQTAQGVGVVFAFALVASAAHLMTTVSKVRSRIHLPHLSNGHFTMKNAPVVQKTLDVIPLTVWFWVAAGVFVLCLIGTLLFVRETVHETEDSEAATKSPLEIKGI